MTFSPKGLRLVLLGLLGLTAVVFTAVTVIGLGLLSDKSQQMVGAKLRAKTAEVQLTNLPQAKKQVEQYAFFNDVAKSVIPTDKDQARAVLEINQIANAAGIAIGSIAFPTSNLSGSSAITQAKPVAGIDGLYSLELTVVPLTGAQAPADKVATYSKVLDFLSRIERNRRTAQITQISLQPQAAGDTNTPINFNLVINIFIRP